MFRLNKLHESNPWQNRTLVVEDGDNYERRKHVHEVEAKTIIR